jgi:plastocyanin
MARIDFGGAVLALLAGFILSAGITGFLLSANGGQVPMPLGHPGIMAGPGMLVSAPQMQAPAPAQAAVAAGPLEVKVIATDLKFNPPTIRAQVGQTVKIVLDNKGMIEHDIAFPTIQADKPAASLKVLAKTGQTATLEFTPTAKGTYEYVCTIPGHKEAGMKGTITVD